MFRKQDLNLSLHVLSRVTLDCGMLVFQDVSSTFPWQITVDFEDTKDESKQQWTFTLETISSARCFVVAMRKAFRKLWTIELEVNCPPGSDLL